jgi:chemotaxis protein methyltransferase CheR
MVGERRPLSIKVEATSGRAVSSEAVSLGLIVTELVINALKHAFPNSSTQGEILVRYESEKSGWCLSISDNGEGIREAGTDGVHTGLGTSIVEALAQQLNAKVQKFAAPTGTNVSVTASAASGWPDFLPEVKSPHP